MYLNVPISLSHTHTECRSRLTVDLYKSTTTDGWKSELYGFFLLTHNFSWECEFAGVEQSTGTVEWTTGVEHWTGLMECHAHKLTDAHKMLSCIVCAIMNQVRP